LAYLKNELMKLSGNNQVSNLSNELAALVSELEELRQEFQNEDQDIASEKLLFLTEDTQKLNEALADLLGKKKMVVNSSGFKTKNRFSRSR
jgi:NTP pyrophosphatase (non-canonical NTP hydrolase)